MVKNKFLLAFTTLVFVPTLAFAKSVADDYDDLAKVFPKEEASIPDATHIGILADAPKDLLDLADLEPETPAKEDPEPEVAEAAELNHDEVEDMVLPQLPHPVPAVPVVPIVGPKDPMDDILDMIPEMDFLPEMEEIDPDMFKDAAPSPKTFFPMVPTEVAEDAEENDAAIAATPRLIIKPINPDVVRMLPNKPGFNNARECPAVTARSDKDCARLGTVNSCWSPGEPDVDCPSSSEGLYNLCCFNGCYNECFDKSECKTVMEDAFEDVTKNKCEIKEEESCRDVPHEACEAVCTMVETPVTSNVEYEDCQLKTESQCFPEEQVSTAKEECLTKNYPIDMFFLSPAAPRIGECPMVEKKPEEVCETEAETNDEPVCWSPGVEDVDCPLPDKEGEFGLCCYDGCKNTCVDKPNKIPGNCEMTTEEVCETGN